MLLTAQPLQTGFIEYDSGHKTEHKAFKMSSVFNICSSKINRESIFLQNNNFYFGYFMNTIFQKSSFMCTEVGLLFSRVGVFGWDARAMCEIWLRSYTASLSGGRAISVTAASPVPSGLPPPDIPLPLCGTLSASLLCIMAVSGPAVRASHVFFFLARADAICSGAVEIKLQRKRWKFFYVRVDIVFSLEQQFEGKESNSGVSTSNITGVFWG